MGRTEVQSDEDQVYVLLYLGQAPESELSLNLVENNNVNSVNKNNSTGNNKEQREWSPYD